MLSSFQISGQKDSGGESTHVYNDIHVAIRETGSQLSVSYTAWQDEFREGDRNFFSDETSYAGDTPVESQELLSCGDAALDEFHATLRRVGHLESDDDGGKSCRPFASIYLRHNKLHSQHLTTLLLSSPSISIPEGFWSHLLLLDLSHNRLTHFPFSTLSHDFPSLRRLILDHNSFKGDADSCLRGIESLPSLRTLDISHNLLTSLPPMLPSTVVSIKASHNQLRHLSILHDLPALTSLDVSHNDIHDLLATPDEVESGPGAMGLKSLLVTSSCHLSVLSLHHNHLDSSDSNMKFFSCPNMPRLRELYVSHNKLTLLPVSFIRSLRQLTTLTLSHNDLTALPSGIHRSVSRHLSVLTLFHNPSLPVRPALPPPTSSHLLHLTLPDHLRSEEERDHSLFRF